jgi:hypothetical protein
MVDPHARAIKELTGRVRSVEEGHRALREEMADNTRTTKAIKSDTAALVEFARSYKATKLLGGIAGKFLLWASLVSAGLATVWVAIKTGHLP